MTTSGEKSSQDFTSQDKLGIPLVSRIITPTDKDVLFGRGNGSTIHNQSSSYRDLINRYKQDYQKEGQHNNVKREITGIIISSIKSEGGRFLRPFKNREGTIVYWYEADDKKAFVKTMDALRVKEKHEQQQEQRDQHSHDGEDQRQGSDHTSKGYQVDHLLASCSQLDDATLCQLIHHLQTQRKLLLSPNDDECLVAGDTGIFLEEMPSVGDSVGDIHQTATQVEFLVRRVQASKETCQCLLDELVKQSSRFEHILSKLGEWQNWYNTSDDNQKK